MIHVARFAGEANVSMLTITASEPLLRRTTARPLALANAIVVLGSSRKEETLPPSMSVASQDSFATLYRLIEKLDDRFDGRQCVAAEMSAKAINGVRRSPLFPGVR